MSKALSVVEGLKSSQKSPVVTRTETKTVLARNFHTLSWQRKIFFYHGLPNLLGCGWCSIIQSRFFFRRMLSDPSPSVASCDPGRQIDTDGRRPETWSCVHHLHRWRTVVWRAGGDLVSREISCSRLLVQWKTNWRCTLIHTMENSEHFELRLKIQRDNLLLLL